MKSEDQILFKLFLNGELEGNELIDFKNKLEQDPSFLEDFKIYKSQQEFLYIKNKNRAALTTLREIAETQRKAGKSKNIDLKTFIKYAAVAIVVFSVGYLGYDEYNDFKRIDSIMAEYEYIPSQGLRSVELADTKLDSAVLLYDLRRLPESKELLEEIIMSESNNQIAIRYLTHIYFLEKEFKSSKRYLVKLDSLGKEDKVVQNLLGEVISQ